MKISFNDKWKHEKEELLFIKKGKKPKTQRQLFYWHYYKFFNDYIVPLLPSNPRILEVGCGRATICHYLRDYNKLHEWYGLDNSQEALDLVKKNTGSPYTYLAEATELPFDDNSFDLVFSMGVIEHVDDYEKFIKEQYRVLQPGGICVIWVVPHKKSIQRLNVFGNDHYHRNSIGEGVYKGFMKEFGFKNVKYIYTTPFPLFTPISKKLELPITLVYRFILFVRSFFMKYPFKASRNGQAFFIYGKKD